MTAPEENLEPDQAPESISAVDWLLRPRLAARWAVKQDRVIRPWAILLLLEVVTPALLAVAVVRLTGAVQGQAIMGMVIFTGLYLAWAIGEFVCVFWIWLMTRILSGPTEGRSMAIAYAMAVRGPLVVGAIVYSALILIASLPGAGSNQASGLVAVMGLVLILAVVVYKLVMVAVTVKIVGRIKGVRLIVAVLICALVLPVLTPTRWIGRIGLEAFELPSGSMIPTLMPADLILVNTAAYGIRNPMGGACLFRYNSPQKGDLVVFGQPGIDELWIKRILAGAGDTLIIENGQMKINGVPIERGPGEDFKYKRLDERGEIVGVAHTRLFEERTGEVSYNVIHQTCTSDMACRYLPATSGTCRPDGTCQQTDLGPLRIPEGYVFVIGDNRDNSRDSRTFGPVPVGYVVGKVVYTLWPLDRLGRP